MNAKLQWIATVLLTLPLAVAAPSSAEAGGLGDYKDQKHKDDSDDEADDDSDDDSRTRQRTRTRKRERDRSRNRSNRGRSRSDDSCRDSVYQDCRSTCNGNQSMCREHCRERAVNRCRRNSRSRTRRRTRRKTRRPNDRDHRHRHASRRDHDDHRHHGEPDHTHRHAEHHEDADLRDEVHKTTRPDRNAEAQSSGSGSPGDKAYELKWDAFTAHVEGGVGALAQNAVGATGHLRMRYGHVGGGATVTHLADGTDRLTEWDFGPAFFAGGPNFSIGAQPSLMVSQGNGVDPLLGGGLRGYGRLMLDQLFIDFDPMLGYINGQWNYHLRTGIGWRFSPNLHVKGAYDQRNILDLSDGVEHEPLQGAFLLIGARWN